jgi:glycosyltransferase involved in cell wall biosynthesis
VTYNGVSPVFKPIDQDETVAVQQKFTNGNPYILFVGAIHKRKNLQRLMVAFERLKKETSLPHQLLIVGEPMWESQQIEIGTGLKEHVSFTGHLPLEQLAEVMAGATIFTFISYFEGFGIPLVEAMKSGTPVLAGDKTSLPEVGGGAALYCDPLNDNDIYEKILMLLSNKELQEKLKELGIERAKKFTWNQTAKGLWNSFEKMISLDKSHL